jgi:hypothetical protein
MVTYGGKDPASKEGQLIRYTYQYENKKDNLRKLCRQNSEQQNSEQTSARKFFHQNVPRFHARLGSRKNLFIPNFGGL